MTYLLRLEIPQGRAGADLIQVTAPDAEQAMANARGIVMPGVEITLVEGAAA